jgi:ferrous-iron efflux pump FieF
VLISLLISELFRNFPLALYADPVSSLLLCGYILYSAYGLLSASVSDLLDRTLEESLQLTIVRLLGEFFDEYEQVHGVRSRRSGKNIFIEVFLEFDGGKRMADVQYTMDKMANSLERYIPESRVMIVPSTSPPATRICLAE